MAASQDSQICIVLQATVANHSDDGHLCVVDAGVTADTPPPRTRGPRQGSQLSIAATAHGTDARWGLGSSFALEGEV
jgi:hypothetical protein